MTRTLHPLTLDSQVSQILVRELASQFSGAEITEVYDYASGGIVLECLLPSGQWEYLALLWSVPAVFRLTSPLPRRARLGPQDFRTLLKGKTLRHLGLSSDHFLWIDLDPPLAIFVALGGRKGFVAACERQENEIRLLLVAGWPPSEDDLRQALRYQVVQDEATTPAEPVYLTVRSQGPGPAKPVAVQTSPYTNNTVEVRPLASASEAVEAFVREALRWLAFSEQKQTIEKALRQRLKKLQKLRENLRSDLHDAEKAEEYRQFGNLLLAYVGSNPRGQQSVSLPSPDGKGTVEIPLDRAKNRVENANEYFRLARKLEQKRRVATERLAQTSEEIQTTEHYLKRLEEVGSFKELHEVARAAGVVLSAEAGGGKRLTRTSEQRNKKASLLDRLLRFRSSDGLEILAGRSAEDNDFLTFHVAKEHDFWFHVAGAPGSHVIVRNPRRLPKCPPRTAQEAAALAAYLSKLRSASTALVHVTQKRYLKKAKGGRPGEVIMKAFQSMYVKPALPES